MMMDQLDLAILNMSITLTDDDGHMRAKLTTARIFRIVIPLNCLASSVVTVLLLVIASITKGVVGSSTRLFVTATFLLDLLALLILLLLQLDLQFLLPELLLLLMPLHNVLSDLLDLLLLASNWLTTFLGLERCLAVRWPFLAKRITNKQRGVCIFTVCLGAALLKLPSFLLLGLQSPYDDALLLSRGAAAYANFSDVVSTRPTTLLLLKSMQSWIVDFVLFLIVPFSIMCWVSVQLFKAVRASRKMRRHRTSSEINIILAQRNDQRVSIFLCAMLLHFLIFQGPLALYTAMFALDGVRKASGIRQYQYLLRPLFVLIFTIKSEANFLFYLYHNYQFRNRVVQMFHYGGGGGGDTNSAANSERPLHLKHSRYYSRFRPDSQTVTLNYRMSTTEAP